MSSSAFVDFVFATISQRIHYENIGGMLIRRDGMLSWQCPDCKARGRSRYVRKTCPECRSKKSRTRC